MKKCWEKKKSKPEKDEGGGNTGEVERLDVK